VDFSSELSWLHKKVESLVRWRYCFGGSLTDVFMLLLFKRAKGLIAGV
jgi:hypothetical protein